MRVRTRDGCSWNGRSGASWITVVSGGGSGDGELRYRVAENQSTDERSGSLSIAGQTFSVRQRGAEPPRPVDVEVEGRVGGLSGSCPNLSLSVSGESVRTDSSTKFKHGNCGDIRPGTKVEVKGQRVGSGPIIAKEVEIDRD